mmetsp:Transcript_10632/g.22602  ORF Transcript_10632/g.22602 Transcript_10632/m.22602 type:complete len:214 (-) Transcript_10632:162-803(-)
MLVLPHLLARIQPLLSEHDEEVDEHRLVASEAAACLVDHVGYVRVARRHGVVHHAAVVAARLALDHLAQILVVQLEVRLDRLLQLCFGPRAQHRDQLLVIAAADPPSVHGLLHRLRVGYGDVVLQTTIVRLQSSAAISHDFHIVGVQLPGTENRRYECRFAWLCFINLERLNHLDLLLGFLALHIWNAYWCFFKNRLCLHVLFGPTTAHDLLF